MGVFEILMICLSAVAILGEVGGSLWSTHREQKNYEDMKQYNSPAEQMKRFAEAGLNPNLAAGQPNTVAQAPQVSNPAESLVNLPGLIDSAYNSASMRESRKVADDVKLQNLNLQRIKVGIQQSLATQALQKGDLDLALKALTYDTQVATQPAVIDKAFADAGIAVNRKHMSDIDLSSYDQYRDAVVRKATGEADYMQNVKPNLEWHKAETARMSVEYQHEDRRLQRELQRDIANMNDKQRTRLYNLAVKKYNLAVKEHNWEKAHYWINVAMSAGGAAVKTAGRMYGIPIR